MVSELLRTGPLPCPSGPLLTPLLFLLLVIIPLLLLLLTLFVFIVRV